MLHKLAATFASLVLCFACVAQALDQRFYSEPFTEGECSSGTKQSPINIVSGSTKILPGSKRTSFAWPTANDVEVLNKGTALQVQWAALADNETVPEMPSGGDGIADALNKGVKASWGPVKVRPVQFHFHSVSEHAFEGRLGTAEAHIVTLVAPGEAPTEWGCDEVWNGGEANFAQCCAVFGVWYELGDESPPYMNALFDAASLTEKETRDYADTFDIASLLPDNKSYWTYQGSLTTPGCNELVRWTVFKNPVKMTSATLAKMQTFMANTQDAADSTKTNNYRTNNRFPQPLNGRTVYSVDV